MDDVPNPDPQGASRVLTRLAGRVDVDAVAGCRNCALRCVCAGGCPAMTVLCRGRPRRAGCAVARTVTECLLWDEADRTRDE